jgi:hypothetical protein
MAISIKRLAAHQSMPISKKRGRLNDSLVNNLLNA